MKSKVYVTQETDHSYIEAERFGEVVFLTAGDISNIRGSLRNEALFRSIKSKLQNFDPEVDYIAPSGSPYVTAVTFLILGIMGHKVIQVLRWDNRNYNYIPIYFDLRRL